MVDYGLGSSGFVPKTAAIIRQELVDASKSKFGDQINVQPETPLGQIIDIMTERYSLLWELTEGIYNALRPDAAEGVSLDNVAALVGITRLNATYSTVTERFYGVATTNIPTSAQVAISGDEDTIFETNIAGIIAAAVNEQQTISFDEIPDAGAWTITYDGETTGSLAYNDNAAAIDTALELLTNIGVGDVSVAGDYTNGFVIEFTGALAGVAQTALTVTHTLTKSAASVVVTITETIEGGSYIDIACTSTATGVISANANSITVIKTPITGLTSVTNKEEAESGRAIETDAALRSRRNANLAQSASATLAAIRAELLEVDNVEQVAAFENTTSSTDGDGRPPHSFEMVVKGGLDIDIAESIWVTKPAGIASFGSSSEIIIDNEGIFRTVYYSRPTEVRIYVIVNITKEAGTTIAEQSVKDALVVYGVLTNMGDDVLPNSDMIPAVTENVANIRDIEILAAITTPPATSTPITIAASELATFAEVDMTINIT